jgi:hypothetical protein
LGRSEGELYAMDMTLSEEETRQYGREEETMMVTTTFVWTSAEQIEGFRQFVSITQGIRTPVSLGLFGICGRGGYTSSNSPPST